ncbi:MAG: hypothetical protein AAB659_00670 [Patescibacteria group bacterium]
MALVIDIAVIIPRRLIAMKAIVGGVRYDCIVECLYMKKEYYFLLLILIIAGALRLTNLTTTPPGLYPDEAMNGNNALEAISTGNFKVFYPENNGREGLFMNIQAGFIVALGNYPWVLRLPSALFGILTVLGIYFMTREMKLGNAFFSGSNRSNKMFGLDKNEFIALAAAFLLAITFWHINFSRIGFRAIMAPFFLVWSVYFLLKALRENSKLIWSFVGGIIYGLGMYSYISYRTTPLLIGVILLIYMRRAWLGGWLKKFFASAFIYIACSIIVFVPLGLYFLHNPADFLGRTTQVSVFSSQTPLKDLSENVVKTLAMFNLQGDGNWRHNISGAPELYPIVGLMFLLGIAISVGALLSRHRPKAEPIIIYSAFLSGFLPVVISNEGIPHALRAIIMIPPVIVLAALGLAGFYEYLSKHISIKTIDLGVISVAVLLVVQAYVSYFIIWAQNPNVPGAFAQDYVDMANEVNRLPLSTPKVIVVTSSDTSLRGFPLSLQTFMFLTNSWKPEEQKSNNFIYIKPEQVSGFVVPEGAVIRFIN